MMAGMWGLYAQAVGSLRHPVRTVRELRAGVLPVAHAASLRPHETGVALRAGGVDLAAIFRLIYWVGLAEVIVMVLAGMQAEPLAGASPVVVGGVLVLSPLLLAVVYAIGLPIYWYWGAFSVRLGFRAVAPWMSWPEARTLLFVYLLPHLALWAVGLSLLLAIAGAVTAAPDGASPGFSLPVLAVSVVNTLLGLFLFIQSIRLVRAFRDLTIWRTLGGLVLSSIIAGLPVFVLVVALGVIGAMTHMG